ncbi:hypothetical protein K1719_045798 [Acacia pycnantha]|nr:hypothetical protein K1719_045798 [Acacia pycnantha]
MVFHIDPIGFDHHLLLIDLFFCEFKAPRYFRFETSWALHEDFLEVVREGWADEMGPTENKVAGLVLRLKAYKEKLVRWSKSVFPNFQMLIDQLKQWLDRYNSGFLTEQTVTEAEELTRQLEEAWSQEELYWWQKSWISWLNCGDMNTKFFHNSVIQRRQRNKVLRLKDEKGIWVVTEEDNNRLMMPITNLEIEEVVFQIGANKAPGPNGYSAHFYQSAWKVIRNDVCGMVNDFFAGEVDHVMYHYYCIYAPSWWVQG